MARLGQISFFLLFLAIVTCNANERDDEFDDFLDPLVAAASSGVDWSSRLSAITTPTTPVNRKPLVDDRDDSRDNQPPTNARRPSRRQKPVTRAPVTPSAPASPLQNYASPQQNYASPLQNYASPQNRHYNPPPNRSFNPQSAASAPKIDSQSQSEESNFKRPISRRPNGRRQAVFESKASETPPQSSFTPSSVQPSIQTPSFQAPSFQPPRPIAGPSKPIKRVVVVRKPVAKPGGSPAPTQSNEPPKEEDPSPFAFPTGHLQDPFFSHRDGYAATQGPNSAYDNGHYSEIRDQVLDSSDELPTRQSEEPYFQPPKFDLPNSKLNEKGCKMVIKELQQVPRDMLEAHGSNLFTVLRSKRSPDKRRVSSIIMTKECYFPDASSVPGGVPSFENPGYRNNNNNNNNNNNKPEERNTNSRGNPPRSSNRNYRQESQAEARYDRKPSSDSYDYPDRYPRQESTQRARETRFPVPQEEYNNSPQPSSSNKKPKQQTNASPRDSQGGSGRSGGGGGYNSGSSSGYRPPYYGPSDHDFEDSFGGSVASSSNLEGGYGDEGFGGYGGGNFGFEDGFGQGGYGGYGGNEGSRQGESQGSRGGQGNSNNRGQQSRSNQGGNNGQRNGAQSSHGGHGGHGGKPQASGQGQSRSGPTPKMVNRSYQFYKKDKGKDEPNNKDNAEEYGAGYYKSYSTDYDSTRDGPQKN